MIDLPSLSVTWTLVLLVLTLLYVWVLNNSYNRTKTILLGYAVFCRVTAFSSVSVLLISSVMSSCICVLHHTVQFITFNGSHVGYLQSDISVIDPTVVMVFGHMDFSRNWESQGQGLGLSLAHFSHTLKWVIKYVTPVEYYRTAHLNDAGAIRRVLSFFLLSLYANVF